MRAERIQASGGSGSFQSGAGLSTSVDAILVDSQLLAGSGPFTPYAITSSATLTLSNCVLAGAVTPTPVLRTVPSAAWSFRAWLPGGTSTVRFTESPNEACAVIASLEISPWTSPVALEPLWIGATPNWFVVSLGVTGATGFLSSQFTIPNTPLAQYLPLWLSGAFVDPLPLRTTCPLGGMIL